MITIQKHLMDPTLKARPTIDTGPGLTEQAHKDATDMNYILRDYRKTGLIKHAAQNQGRYDDISVQDFQSAMFMVTQAKSMFESLPADMRKRFENDPAKFLAFTQDHNNKPEMAKMGILKGNDGLDINNAQVNTPVKDPDPVPEPVPPRQGYEK